MNNSPAGCCVFQITLCFILVFSFNSCSKQEKSVRTSMDLSGSWQFSMDTAQAGIPEKWFLKDLPDSILLPGTMDLNRKGFRNTDTTTMHLNRVYVYEGVAWYRKEISVPENWRDKHIQLIMERTKPSKVWIDEKYSRRKFTFWSQHRYSILHPFLRREDTSLRLE